MRQSVSLAPSADIFIADSIIIYSRDAPLLSVAEKPGRAIIIYFKESITLEIDCLGNDLGPTHL